MQQVRVGIDYWFFREIIHPLPILLAVCGITGLGYLMLLLGSIVSDGVPVSVGLSFRCTMIAVAIWCLYRGVLFERVSSPSISIPVQEVVRVWDSSQTLEHLGITHDRDSGWPALSNSKMKVHPAPELSSARTSYPLSEWVCPFKAAQYAVQNSMTPLPSGSRNTKGSRSGSTVMQRESKVECKQCVRSASCTRDKLITSTRPMIQSATVKRRSKDG
jgi:hypothetical protein